jgi:hypothetical protein
MDPIRLDRDSIKKLVAEIRSLDQGQRRLIKETLEGLSRSSDRRISPEELRKALSGLRHAHLISEIDEDAITRAVFPE